MVQEAPWRADRLRERGYAGVVREATAVSRSALTTLMAAVVACSSAPPPVARPDPAVIARADAEILSGCYDCLVAAQTIYRRLATGPARAALLGSLFEADLLIALREKELGIPPSDAIDEARRIAGELPHEIEPARYLALVDAVPPEQLGQPRRATMAHILTHAPKLFAPGARDWLAGGKLRPVVREYLQRTIDCMYPTAAVLSAASGVPAQGGPLSAPPDPTDPAVPADPRALAAPANGLVAPPPPVAPPPDAPPLIAFRAAACGLGSIDALTTVRDREPRFIETSLFIAAIEIAIAGDVGPGWARARLTEVLGRFPSSPAVLYLTASYEQLVGNFTDALALYEQTLALQPLHERALLGRVVCLSNLDRPLDAIHAATQLIELGVDNASEAYYWRAWNHHKIKRLADARSDISSAKQRSTTPVVLSLAGVVAYDQNELDPAEADLEAAIALAPGDCTARWYLAMVARQRRRMLVTGQSFEATMLCYRARVADSTSRRDSLQARSDLDPAYRAGMIASLQASIDNDGRQQRQCAFLAASHHASAGDLTGAARLLELVGEDPELAARVAKLRGTLGKLRHTPKAATKATR